MASRADAFDCPVCWEPLRRPIYQCLNGHLICSACTGRLERSSNKVCPTCRVALGDERIRSLEADRRADNRHRPSPYTPPPAPRVPAPREPLMLLPESAQRAMRRFSTDACAKSRSIYNVVQGPLGALVEMFVFKISDELIGFRDEPLVLGGGTIQLQIESNSCVQAGFAESFDVFLHARPTSPNSVEELRNAGIELVIGDARSILYIAAFDAKTVDNVIRLTQEFLRSKRRQARFLIRTEMQKERVFHAPPPFGSPWINLLIDSKDSKVTLLFDGNHYIYRERLDMYGIAGIYMSDKRFCRGLEVDASEGTEREHAQRVIRDVFKGLVMRVYLVGQPTSPYAVDFVAELRCIECLRFM